MGDLCAQPFMNGPNKGKPATGTNGGYYRHRRHGEPACAACLKAHSVHVNGYVRPKAKKKKGRYGPEPKTTGLPRRRLTEPKFTGSQLVVCACGRRGSANRALVGRRKRVEECAECR